MSGGYDGVTALIQTWLKVLASRAAARLAAKTVPRILNDIHLAHPTIGRDLDLKTDRSLVDTLELRF